MPNKPRRPRLAHDSPRRDVAIGALDVAVTTALTGVALMTHTLLLLLPAAGWAYLALPSSASVGALPPRLPPPASKPSMGVAGTGRI